MDDIHIKEEELSSDKAEMDEEKLFPAGTIKVKLVAESIEYVNIKNSPSCNKTPITNTTVKNPIPFKLEEIHEFTPCEAQNSVNQSSNTASQENFQGRHVRGKSRVDSKGGVYDASSPGTSKDDMEVSKVRPAVYKDLPQMSILPRAQTNSVELLNEHDMIFGHFIEPSLVEDNSSPAEDDATPQEKKVVKCKQKKPKHSVEKIFECDECKQKFSQKGNLNVHKRIHTGEKRFECDQCPQKFWQKFHLKVHLRVHTGEKPYECDVCNKRFSQKSMVTVHKRLHTGEKDFECDVCKQRFSRKFHLQLHSRVHTGEQPFECTDCNQKFTQKSTLVHHQRKHAGVTPYECCECDKRFTLKSRLKTHLRSHSGERPFECDMCKQTFLQRSHLNVHIIVAHRATEKPTFECVECNKKFRNELYLQNHLLKKHFSEQVIGDCKERLLLDGLGGNPPACGVREEDFMERSNLGFHEKSHRKSDSSTTNS